MNIATILQELQGSKLAAKRYQNQDRSKFRDCVTICSNGKLRFERFCYGEAAGLVCTMWANECDVDGNIAWLYDDCAYTGKHEAPQKLTGAQGGSLLFDNRASLWQATDDFKTMPRSGTGFLQKLFGKK